MRRLALSVFTACGLALLTACGSGGGYGFSTSGNSTGSVDQVILSAAKNGQANDFFVAPGGTAPLQVDAIGQKGSGPFAVVVPDATFTWSARFINPATDGALAIYQVGPAPATPKVCGAPSSTPAVPILQQSLTSIAPPYPGFAPLPNTQAARTVYVGAVPGVTPATPNNPTYCLVLNATHVSGGEIGSHVIVVSNSP